MERWRNSVAFWRTDKVPSEINPWLPFQQPDQKAKPFASDEIYRDVYASMASPKTIHDIIGRTLALGLDGFVGILPVKHQKVIFGFKIFSKQRVFLCCRGRGFVASIKRELGKDLIEVRSFERILSIGRDDYHVRAPEIVDWPAEWPYVSELAKYCG